MRKYASLFEVQDDLYSNQTTCVELVKYYLNRISENAVLNAFLEVFDADALAQATFIDSKIKTKTAGRLAGMVIGIKDNIAYKGHKFSASSRILEGFESVYSSTVVERLLKEDAIIIGRLNCDEFAMGSSNENSAFGKVLHPLDHSRVPGGSSGGSAVAVAADLCLATLGSDTGGSIRQPAAFCGVYGLKPTYGRVSRYGIIAFASSFDQVGPFTRSLSDAAILTEVMSGVDGFDATLSRLPAPVLLPIEKSKGKKRIAVIKDLVAQGGLHQAVIDTYLASIEKLKLAGNIVEEVSFDYIKYTVPAYYMLTTAEASSNLSRFGGVVYGYRSDKSVDLDSTYKKSRTEGFGAEVKRRIMLGTFVLSEGFFDAYYTKAQKVRRVLRNKLAVILQDYEALLLPSTPSPAFKFGEKSKDPIEMYLEDIFTVLANLTGMPAISVPCAVDADNMPIGMQIIVNNFEEKKLFECAQELETIWKT